MSASAKPAPLPTVDIAAVLLDHYEGANYELFGRSYADLRWLDERPKPTEAELVALADPTGETRRAAARAAINAERDRRIAGGFAYDFGGEIGVKRLQSRDLEDRFNWLLSLRRYAAEVDAGRGDDIGAVFRGEDNKNFVIPYAAGHAALQAMEAWGTAILARSWTLKDALDAGADPTALDLTAGWPE